MDRESKLLFIDVHSQYMRVAFVENGELIEFHIESNNHNKIVGNIYKGQVVNVLSGMQAAFVDIGLHRNGYLYVGDYLVDNSDISSFKLPSELKISTGDKILVQVVKDEVGAKGARITCNISLPGRLLVLMPGMDYVGVSSKITDEEKRTELSAIVEAIRPKNMGFILRTASENATEEEIAADASYLLSLWENIQEKYKSAKVKDCIHSEGNLYNRVIRDLYRKDINAIYVNDTSVYNEVKSLISRIAGDSDTDIVKLYDRAGDMFTAFKLNTQIDRLTERQVWLKNGAHLVFDYSEALTVIDVNTGKFVGDNNLEETVFVTNMLAAKEIGRQLRLRNIGGIIIVDFIDMELEEHRKMVLETLKEILKEDRIKCTVMGMTNLGLVEITRKKTRNNAASTMMSVCPYCEGEGRIFSDEFNAMRIRAAILNLFSNIEAKAALVTVSEATFLSVFQRSLLSEEEKVKYKNKLIYIIPDKTYHNEQFTVKAEWSEVLSLPENAKLLY